MKGKRWGWLRPAWGTPNALLLTACRPSAPAAALGLCWPARLPRQLASAPCRGLHRRLPGTPRVSVVALQLCLPAGGGGAVAVQRRPPSGAHVCARASSQHAHRLAVRRTHLASLRPPPHAAAAPRAPGKASPVPFLPSPGACPARCPVPATFAVLSAASPPPPTTGSSPSTGPRQGVQGQEDAWAHGRRAGDGAKLPGAKQRSWVCVGVVAPAGGSAACGRQRRPQGLLCRRPVAACSRAAVQPAQPARCTCCTRAHPCLCALCTPAPLLKCPLLTPPAHSPLPRRCSAWIRRATCCMCGARCPDTRWAHKQAKVVSVCL